ELIKQLGSYDVKLLAEKVETHEEYQYLLELGCDYFQGFFFNKPNIVAGKRLSVNQLSAIKLLTTINDPDVEFAELGNIISQDVGLSYKLLHYINSAFFAVPNKVDSINQAIAYLGLHEVRRWINILTLSSMSDKPQAVMQTALIRAKMCEQLAKLTGHKTENFFLVGMLSSLDSILDMPIAIALQQLPLANDIVSAILDKQGPAGEALECVLGYEQLDISAINFAQLDPLLIGNAYIESINWAKDLLDTIK
ncbi:MAG: HDOD domain-containing protein, partial [Methylococcaceae bacterium]|nr:HDOD domain-containing protein [Methylococcaceae bacterium]